LTNLIFLSSGEDLYDPNAKEKEEAKKKEKATNKEDESTGNYTED
jgi:hypothetical protein